MSLKFKNLLKPITLKNLTSKVVFNLLLLLLLLLKSFWDGNSIYHFKNVNLI